MKTIGIVMACHNRREKTLRCLAALAAQSLPDGVVTRTYLLDDGSTDGTGDAVRAARPDVVVLEGDGTLHWNGGMRAAYGAALAEGHDYYVWMNDDTYLHADAFARLLAVHDGLAAAHGPAQIVVGSTHEPGTARLSYGGFVRTSRWHPLKFSRVVPRDVAVECDTINGNCVLIPAEVAARVGNIDERWSHAGFIGDNDYGLRARRAGCRNWVAPGFIGECESNPPSRNSADVSLSPRVRWAHLTGPKEGHAPLRIARYLRRHGGWYWPLLWSLQYGRIICRFALDGVRHRTLFG